jgi:hypothetical protein
MRSQSGRAARRRVGSIVTADSYAPPCSDARSSPRGPYLLALQGAHRPVAGARSGVGRRPPPHELLADHGLSRSLGADHRPGRVRHRRRFRRLRLGPGRLRGLLGSDPRDASRRREDAGMPVLPPDADARRIFVEHLLDHPCPARLCCSFGLDNDPVSNVNAHLRLAPLSVRPVVPLGEVSATIRESRKGTPLARRWRIYSHRSRTHGSDRLVERCLDVSPPLVDGGALGTSVRPG